MYSNNPIYATLAEVIGVIAHDETDGDRNAACIDLVAAAADGAIKGYAARREERGTDKIRTTTQPGLQEMPAWVWQCVRRKQARISDDEREIVIRALDSKTQEPLTIRYFDIRFEWAWVNLIWPEPKPARQPSAKEVLENFESFRAANRRRRPGPRPAVTTRVAEAMRAAVSTGNITVAELRDMKQEAMKAQFGASAQTCRIARAAVLAEFDSVPSAPIAAQ